MAGSGMGDVWTDCLIAPAAQGVRAGLFLWRASCLAADELVGARVGPIVLTPCAVAVRIRRVVNAATVER